jgi:hypothetical protein
VTPNLRFSICIQVCTTYPTHTTLSHTPPHSTSRASSVTLSHHSSVDVRVVELSTDRPRVWACRPVCVRVCEVCGGHMSHLFRNVEMFFFMSSSVQRALQSPSVESCHTSSSNHPCRASLSQAIAHLASCIAAFTLARARRQTPACFTVSNMWFCCVGDVLCVESGV